MLLPKYSGKLKKPKFIFIRQVAGTSMNPRLRPGQVVLASSFFRRLRPGQVIIIRHRGREKVKRIERIVDRKLFVIGDNLAFSTDSRHFGWIDPHEVLGRVIWPKVSNS